MIPITRNIVLSNITLTYQRCKNFEIVFTYVLVHVSSPKLCWLHVSVLYSWAAVDSTNSTPRNFNIDICSLLNFWKVFWVFFLLRDSFPSLHSRMKCSRLSVLNMKSILTNLISVVLFRLRLVGLVCTYYWARLMLAL